MLKLNKIVSMALAIGMIASMSTSAFASKQVKMRTVTEHKMTDDRYIIAAHSNPTAYQSLKVSFDHFYGVTKEPLSSKVSLEKVWGKTYHYVVESGKPNRNVDGYTRARWENGKSIKGDSGRCWDSDDGGIGGYSEATSGWMVNKYYYIGKTYYGN